MKSVWVIRDSISVTDWACLPNTNLLNVVLRCWSPPGDTFGVFGRILDTVFWRTPANMWPEMLNLQDQTASWPLPAPCHSPVTPQMIKLLPLHLLNAEFCDDLNLTLPLACALDLAALENIPSLSFRNVHRYQTLGNEAFLVCWSRFLDTGDASQVRRRESGDAWFNSKWQPTLKILWNMLNYFLVES